MSDPTAADAAAAGLAPAPSKSRLLPIMLVFQSLLLVGVLALVFLRGGGGGAAPAAAAEHKEEPAEKGEGAAGEPGHAVSPGSVGPTVRLADFVIRLRDPEADRYARMSFELEVGGEADKERVSAHLPKIRDAFIGYLSDRTLEELRGSERLAETKKALVRTLQELVPDLRIRALYITDFVIQ